MSDVKVWQDGYGRNHYQPVRCDGYVLTRVFHPYYTDRSWMSLAEVGGRPSRPVTHRLRWVAHLRAKSATRRYNRRVLSEVRPVNLAAELDADPELVGLLKEARR